MGKSIQEEIQQRNWHNDQQVAVINILYTYHWVKGRISEALAPYKITMQQYNVLRILRGAHPRRPCHRCHSRALTRQDE